MMYRVSWSRGIRCKGNDFLLYFFILFKTVISIYIPSHTKLVHIQTVLVVVLLFPLESKKKVVFMRS